MFQAIPLISKTGTLQWVLALKLENIFDYIFWTVNHMILKLSQVMDIVVGIVIVNIFGWFGGLGIKSRPFSVY